MKIKSLTFCLLIVTIFLSCKKEELLNTGNPGNTYIPMLSKVLIDNQPAYEYIYTSSNLIGQEKSKFDLRLHYYNDNGLLITTESYGNDDLLSTDLKIIETAMNKKELITMENGKKAGTITYDYNINGQLIKTTYSLPSSGSSEYSLFSYGDNNKIIRQTIFWENTVTGYIDYSYDGKGNLIKEMLYYLPSTGIAELITTTAYSLDNQSNPYKSTSRLMTPGITTNLNNIINETYTIHLAANQGADKVQITETSYQYNGMGYPTSKTGNVTYIYK